eukprot:1108929-Rhodomonas_salina.1
MAAARCASASAFKLGGSEMAYDKPVRIAAIESGTEIAYRRYGMVGTELADGHRGCAVLRWRIGCAVLSTEVACGGRQEAR